MALPIIPLPSSSVEVNGATVTFRSLSRAEALSLQDYRGREDEAESLILQWACDATPEAAQLFRAGTTTEEAGKLLDAILIFSGLATAAQAKEAKEKEEPLPDPKSDTNGHLQTADLTLTRS